jgi:hypothetical protein
MAFVDCISEVNFQIRGFVSYLSCAGQCSWAFVPVVDDEFALQLPSKQLLSGKVNGRQVLTRYVGDSRPKELANSCY